VRKMMKMTRTKVNISRTKRVDYFCGRN
jgi:hypothetical protein